MDAEEDSITAGKMIYDTRLPAIRAINSKRGEIKEWWEEETLPYAQDGVRLLPKNRVEWFNARMQLRRQELFILAADVQYQRDLIVEDAMKRLGEAFNLLNYPDDLSISYGMEWSFPSLEPAGDLPPQIYEQQAAQIRGKLEEAVQLAEQAFLIQFLELVESLHERLTPGADGARKVFRDSAVNNFQEFFTRFQKLSLGSNQELETLVSSAKELVFGIEPKELRKGHLLREEVSTGLSRIKDKLAPLVIKKPRRAIILPQPQEANAS